MTEQYDNVNSPKHYISGGVECIEAIKAALTPEEFRGFCKGNIIKYAWRERAKGGNESLRKAVWYADKAVEESSDQKPDDDLGWIAYDPAKDCIPDCEWVLAKYRGRSADKVPVRVSALYWDHLGLASDIIAYKVVA